MRLICHHSSFFNTNIHHTQPQEPVSTGLVGCSSPSLYLLRDLQQPPLLKILRNLGNRVLYTLLITPDVDLRVLRRLVRAADTSELGDLARAGKLVQTLGVTRLGDLERQVDEDLDELERRVVALDFSVQRACGGAVCGEGRDEGGDGDCGGVGEELCDLVKPLVRVT